MQKADQDFELTKDIPYLTHEGEVWDVFCEHSGLNISLGHIKQTVWQVDLRKIIFHSLYKEIVKMHNFFKSGKQKIFWHVESWHFGENRPCYYTLGYHLYDISLPLR